MFERKDNKDLYRKSLATIDDNFSPQQTQSDIAQLLDAFIEKSGKAIEQAYQKHLLKLSSRTKQVKISAERMSSPGFSQYKLMVEISGINFEEYKSITGQFFLNEIQHSLTNGKTPFNLTTDDLVKVAKRNIIGSPVAVIFILPAEKLAPFLDEGILLTLHKKPYPANSS